MGKRKKKYIYLLPKSTNSHIRTVHAKTSRCYFYSTNWFNFKMVPKAFYVQRKVTSEQYEIKDWEKNTFKFLTVV